MNLKLFTIITTTTLLIFAGSLLPKKSIKETEVLTPIVPVETLTEASIQVKKNKLEILDVDASRVVFFNAVVTPESVDLAISRLKSLSSSKEDIYLVLNSPGGSVFDGNRLLSVMEGSNAKVHTICAFLCASMAAQIHQHGAKRYMLDRSVLMFHQATGGAGGQMKEAENFFTFMKREIKKLDAYVAFRSGIPTDVFDHMVEHELWIAADDALNKHLTDGLAVLNVAVDDPAAFNITNELKKHNISLNKAYYPTLDNPLEVVY